MNNIKNYINFVFFSKKVFLLPKKKEILIFDQTGSHNFFKYLKRYNYSILRTRYEELNIPIFFKTFFQFKFNYQSYLINYINCVNPKLILTYMDNNPRFYKLKKEDSSFKTVFVQYGIRSSFNDIFALKSKLKKRDNKVDKMFLANKTICKKYSSFVNGQTIPIGYFKNNMVKILKTKKKKEILYISVFRNYKNSQRIFKNVTYGDFFSNDSFFFKWLEKYCLQNKLKINILARSDNNKNFLNEKKYFEQFFSSPNIIFENKNPYKHLDKYEYIITNDSTLGIENLARGGKACFVCNAPNKFPLNTRKFGFTEGLKKNGPFWTRENNSRQFKKVLDYLIKSKRKSWKKYVDKVVMRDKNNKIFQECINNILKN